MQSLFQSNGDYARDVIDAANRFSQISSLRDLQQASDGTALTEALAPTPPVIQALERVIGAPHLRWHREANGRLMGTYLDDAPDSRLRTIIKWAEETRSRDLLAMLTLGHEHLQKGLSFFIPSILDVLRALETSPWVYEHGGAELHHALMDGILDNLSSARNYDWRSLFDYRATSPPWPADHEARFGLEYQAYRRRGVYDEVAECQELADLESMRDGLRDIQRSHRQVFRTVIKKLNVAIEQTRKSMDDDSDDGYQPISESKRATPENMDDVRRLFGSLV
jgi:hypothetical protein